MYILETIAAKTRERTEAEKKQLSLETVRNMAEDRLQQKRKRKMDNLPIGFSRH